MRLRGKLLLWVAIDAIVIGVAAHQVWNASLPFGNASAPRAAPPDGLRPTRPEEHRIRVGDLAPNFTLPRIADGRLLRLADLHTDKPVVLMLSSFT